MLNRFRADLKAAMKDKKVKEKEVLQNLIGKYTLAEKEKKETLTEDEGYAIVSSEIKKVKDALADFEKANREDLIADAKGEIEILAKYLPQMMTEAEIEDLVKSTISELNLDKPNMGLVMKAMTGKVNGRADMSLVSKLVKANL